MKVAGLPPGVLAVLALWTMGTACGRRQEPPPMPRTDRPAPREAAAKRLPPEAPGGAMRRAVPVDEIPPEIDMVWWNVTPAGATVRITAPDGKVKRLVAEDRVGLPLKVDFYTVEITHPDYAPWMRRMALGGSITNLTLALAPRPGPTEAPLPPLPPPAPPPAPAPAAPAADLATLEPSTTLPAVAEAAPAALVRRSAPPPPRADLRPLNIETLVAESPPPTVAAPPAAAGPRMVRIAVRSSIPGDTALAQAPRHLHIGRHDVRLLPPGGIELPRAAIGGASVALRIAQYAVEPPSRTLPHDAAEDPIELSFTAVPRRVTAVFAGAPEHATVWAVTEDGARRPLGLAAHALPLAPFAAHAVEVRAPGFQPLALTLRGDTPGAALPTVDARLLPLPFRGRPGQLGRIDLGHGVDLPLAWVPGGEVVLSDPRLASAPPDVRVAMLPRGFWMATTETTVRQWAAVMEGRREDGPAAGLPKTGVDWMAAAAFAARLARLAPQLYARLPSEAEWEHAAKAVDGAPFGGVPAGDVHGAAAGRVGARPADVGTPNAWGLRNLAGNVREWCADAYGPYRGRVPTPPLRRVVRGGSFRVSVGDCAVDVRDVAPPATVADDLGFRLVLPAATAVPPPPPPAVRR